MALQHEDWKKELEPPPRVVERGQRGDDVRRVQEWISLHRYHTAGFRMRLNVDAHYGPATVSAVERFQEVHGLEVTGVVDEDCWTCLVAPMARAFGKLTVPSGSGLRKTMLYLARRFEQEHPTELRTNKGPWVRAFMKGYDGRDFAWCDGFISTVIDHACNHVGLSMNEVLPWSWSCTKTRRFAESGDYRCRWIDPDEVEADPSQLSPGDLMLVVKPGKSTARHIGIIEEIHGRVLQTIEGNTNDEGSREGYEVCELRRDTGTGRYGAVHFELD